MSTTGILVRVPAKDLPSAARNLLDPYIARPPNARFLVRHSRNVWAPAAWLIALLIIGIVSTRATITAGLDPDAGAQRFIYAVIAAVAWVSALFAARAFLLGLTERRAFRAGTYRQGLHVLGLEGLLIARRDEHTWVPRESLPPAVDVTTHSGGRKIQSFTFLIVDASGQLDRLDCGVLTKNTLSMWCNHAYLPDGNGWV